MSIPETVLSSPLMREEYPKFLNYLNLQRLGGAKKPVNRGEALASKYAAYTKKDPTYSIRAHESSDNPSLWSLGDQLIGHEDSRNELKLVGAIVQKTLFALHAGLSAKEATAQPVAPSLVSQVTPDKVASTAPSYVRMVLWQEVVEIMVRQERKRGGWVAHGPFDVSGKFVVLRGTQERVLMTSNVVLMIKDLTASRWLVHLCSVVVPNSNYLLQLLTQYDKWASKALHNYGNCAYDLLKGVEALSKVRIIALSDNILDGTGQLSHMAEKYRGKEKEVALEASTENIDSVGALVLLLESMVDPSQVSEFFGFMKLSGHPYIDAVAGCISARDIAKARIPLRPRDIQQLDSSFCHLYCRGYLEKTGRWPPIQFDRPDGATTRLEELYESSQPVLPMGLSMYPPDDWAHAKFLPHHNFSTGEDILSLITDKALSYKRSEFDAPWKGSLPHVPPRPTSSNRVLSELLSRPSFDLARVCNQVSQRSIPNDWKIVTVSPKEREMKRKPRMFAMMVLDMRSFFVLLEQNISKGPFSYIPEQTMTLTRTQLIDRFLSSSGKTRRGWCRAYVEVDFERWNLRWRDETVGPIGNRFDQMFGTQGLFTYVHEFFRESLINLRVYDIPPTGVDGSTRLSPPESDTVWYDHLGGFEGIAQKLWTACTVAAIHMSLWPLGVSYKILGQADNQVCIIDIKIPTSIRADEERTYVQSIVSQAKQAIESECAKVGQIIKAEECIESTSLVTYGKEMWLNGAYLPTVAKYLSRIFPSFTPDNPSTFAYLSNISSGGIAATERGAESRSCYALTKVVECLFLRREFSNSILHDTALYNSARDTQFDLKGTSFWILLLLLPQNLGGLPVSTVTEFFYRGHSDPLASSLVALELHRGINIIGRYLEVLTRDWVYQSRVDLAGLVMDPYAAPLELKPVPHSAVASAVRGILPEITKNKDIRPLCGFQSEADNAAIIGAITRLRPCYPKVWHDVYNASPVGVASAFARRFTNSRTVLTTAKAAEVDLLGVSLSADRRLLTSVVSRMTYVAKLVANPLASYCRLAEVMRERWGLGRLNGVTTIHPLSRGHFHLCQGKGPGFPREGCFNCGMQVGMVLSTHSTLCGSTRGPVQPYLGSGTSDKMTGHWVRPVDSSPPLEDVIKLLTIRSTMTVPGSSAARWLKALAQSRSLIDVSYLSRFVKLKVGGKIAHRYATRDDSRGSFLNVSPNWASHLTLSSNLAGRTGEDDYPVDFQENMLTTGALTTWHFTDEPASPPFGVVVCFDVKEEDLLADHILEMGESPPDVPCLPVDSYYMHVQHVNVSSRALDVAGLSGAELDFSPTDATPLQALATVLLQELTGRLPLFRFHGRTWAEPKRSSLVDIPDVYHIREQQAIDAMAEATLKHVASKLIIALTRRSDLGATLITTSEATLRRLVPRALGTITKIDRGNTSCGWRPGLAIDDERRTLAWWVWRCTKRVSELVTHLDQQVVFSYGIGSVSSSIYSSISRLLLAYVFQDPACLPMAKRARRLTHACISCPLEGSRVSRLSWLLKCVGLHHRFGQIDQAPQQTLRALRGLHLSVHVSQPRISLPTVLTTSCGQCAGTGKPLSLSHPAPFRPCDLVDSWMLRPAPIRSSACHRWSPIQTLVPQHASVLVVGIGVGGISQVLPPTCSITGLDLASQLQSLGQDCVTYHPPLVSQTFMLHPASWTTTGSVYDPVCRSILEDDIRMGKYDIVLLDMEGGRPTERLHLRHKLAGVSQRCKVYVKVLVNRDDRPALDQSLCAWLQPGDVVWETTVGVQRELILGGGASPLGLYTGVGDCRFAPCQIAPLPITEDDRTYALVTLLYKVTGLAPASLTHDQLDEFIVHSRAVIIPGAPNLTSQFNLELLTSYLQHKTLPRQTVKAIVSILALS